jgi:transmembrane E3 ubiquitin-protein ligase
MGPAAGARRSGGAVMRTAAVGVAVALVSLALAPPLAAALRPLRARVRRSHRLRGLVGR